MPSGRRAAWTRSVPAWLTTDARLTKDAVQKHEFKFLWKSRFENDTRQLNSLTEPILLDRLIGFRGFKALAFIGGSGDRVFAIDTDLGKPYWTTHLNYSANTGGQPASSWSCPGGSDCDAEPAHGLAPGACRRRRGGGRGGRSGSAVGAAGRAAPQSSASRVQQARGGAAQGSGAARRPPVRGTRRRGNSPAVAPVPFGGVDPRLRGGRRRIAPHAPVEQRRPTPNRRSPFLPPSARPASLVLRRRHRLRQHVDGCGAAPNAVWAIDLTSKERKVTTWTTGGASVAGSGGPTFGTTGTLYVPWPPRHPALRLRPNRLPGSRNAVVALDRKTLERKDWFTAEGADFNASPTVIRYKDRTSSPRPATTDGCICSTAPSLGGADHKTPLHVTAKYTAAGAGSALATWESRGHPLDPRDSDRRVAAGRASSAATRRPGADGSVVAFKLVDENGKLVARARMDLAAAASPLAPIVVNGMVVRRVERRIHGQRRRPADRRAARAAFDPGGVVCARRGHRRRDVEQRHAPSRRLPARVCRPAPGRSTSSPTTTRCTRSASRWSTEPARRARAPARPTLGPSRFRARVDNITHSFVGVAIAELARPATATPDERRMLTAGAVIAANLPDIDLAYTWITPPPLGYLLHHRGYTHTVAGLLALAVGLPLAMRLWPAVRGSSSRALAWLWGTVAINLIGHVALDALNSYGVHPFYPFDTRWYYGDAVFIFEPLVWLIFGIAAACNARSRAVRVFIAGLLFVIFFAITVARVDSARRAHRESCRRRAVSRRDPAPSPAPPRRSRTDRGGDLRRDDVRALEGGAGRGEHGRDDARRSSRRHRLTGSRHAAVLVDRRPDPRPEWRYLSIGARHVVARASMVPPGPVCFLPAGRRSAEASPPRPIKSPGVMPSVSRSRCSGTSIGMIAARTPGCSSVVRQSFATTSFSI